MYHTMRTVAYPLSCKFPDGVSRILCFPASSKPKVCIAGAQLSLWSCRWKWTELETVCCGTPTLCRRVSVAGSCPIPAPSHLPQLRKQGYTLRFPSTFTSSVWEYENTYLFSLNYEALAMYVRGAEVILNGAYDSPACVSLSTVLSCLDCHGNVTARAEVTISTRCQVDCTGKG